MVHCRGIRLTLDLLLFYFFYLQMVQFVSNLKSLIDHVQRDCWRPHISLLHNADRDHSISNQMCRNSLTLFLSFLVDTANPERIGKFPFAFSNFEVSIHDWELLLLSLLYDFFDRLVVFAGHYMIDSSLCVSSCNRLCFYKVYINARKLFARNFLDQFYKV